MVLVSSTAFAATVHLNNGQEVSGTILSQTAKNVKIDVNGTTMTYYADEVKDVDGVALGAGAAPTKDIMPVRSVSAGSSATSSSKKVLILKFVEVFGTRKAMTENLGAMLKSLPEDDTEAQKLKYNIKVDEIIDRLVPIYDKQFSEQDLQAFIDFYSSPAGRKLVEGIPVIMRQSVDVSTRYFQEKFPELKAEK